MAASKISYYGKVLIDLTGDTVAANKMVKGTTAHGKDGLPVTGTLEVVQSGNWMRIPEELGRYEDQYIHV